MSVCYMSSLFIIHTISILIHLFYFFQIQCFILPDAWPLSCSLFGMRLVSSSVNIAHVQGLIINQLRTFFLIKTVTAHVKYGVLMWTKYRKKFSFGGPWSSTTDI